MVLAPQAPSAQAEQTLATYRIGGKDVPARIPAGPGPLAQAANVVEWQGDKYLFTPDGGLVRRFRGDGGWGEVRARYEAAKARITPETPEWRVKAFVLSRCDVLDRGESGVLRVRRNTLDTAHLTDIQESLARFAAMAEGWSGGALRVRVDIEFDTDWMRLEASASTKPEAFAEEFRRYVHPRINGGAFEPEDRVYRGPYDSVFVFHCALIGSVPTVRVYDAPVSPIAYFSEGPATGKDALSWTIFSRWSEHLLTALAHHGFPTHGIQKTPIQTSGEEIRAGFAPFASPDGLFPAEMWGKALNRTDPATAELVARLGAEIAGMPVLSSEALSSAAGRGLELFADSRSFRIGAGANSGGGALDTEIEWGKEGMALVPAGDRALLFVAPAFAGFVGAHLPAAMEARALGWTSAGGYPVAVFEVGKPLSAASERELLGLPAASAPAEVAPEQSPSRAGELVKTGAFRAEDVQDQDRGAVVTVTVGGFPRFGAVWLVGEPGGPDLLALSENRYVSLWLRPENPEPMELRVYGSAFGPEGAAAALFGTLPAPAELSSAAGEMPQAGLDAQGGWQQLVLDLSALAKPGVGGGVSGVVLASSRFAHYWPVTRPVHVPSVRVHDLKLSSEAAGTLTPLSTPSAKKPDASSSDPLERALFAAQLREGASASEVEAAIRLMRDSKDLVRLSSIAAFTRVKSQQAEQPITDALRGIDHRVAEQAAAALAFQGTETAWAALHKTVEIGPYDPCREFAAREVASRKDPRSLGSLTAMLVARSWRARLAGAEAMGALPSEQAAMALMTYLQTSDPAVRLAAVRGANASIGLVCRRLLWTAVNDDSDAVRAASYLALLRSPVPSFVEEGAKGVRDDSKAVRLAILDSLRSSPMEAARGALRIAVTDLNPEVRAAALRAFAAMQGPVAPEEVSNTAADPDPRVRAAYRELAAAKGLRPPGQELSCFLMSSYIREGPSSNPAASPAILR